MSVLVSESNLGVYDLSEVEPVVPVIEVEDTTPRIFPNIIAAFPVLVILQAAVVVAGMTVYHVGMQLVSRVHLLH